MEPRQEQISPQEQQPEPETYQAPSAIYEEIQEDIVSLSLLWVNEKKYIDLYF